MRIGILAGEASGDLLGAQLIQALRKRCPNVVIEGIGGQAMMAAGCHSLYDIEQLAVMGFIEPLMRLPSLITLRHNIIKHFTTNKPDIFIGVDAPDFNLGIERVLRSRGIKTVHYVSPSVWAWRRYRIHKIAKAVDLMLTLLPFEAAFYREHQVPVKYVGHPLALQIPLEPDVVHARRSLGLDEKAIYIALLPGSRRQEIKHLAEPMLLAAKRILAQYPQARFITSHVNEHRYQQFHAYFKQYAPELPLTFFTRRSHDVMAASDVIVVASGTATLEAMLFKKPMVITYRMSWFTEQLAKWLVKTPFAGLPNLLAGKLLVPELIQQAATSTAMADEVINYLAHPEKVTQLKKQFTDLHLSLRADSLDETADAILNIIKK